MKFSRRNFLKTSFGAAAAMTAAGAFDLVAQDKARIPIGLQLYAVRGEFERDVPGTLKAVKNLGYKGVEFWGYSGTPNVFKDYSAKQLKTMLDDLGLRCCGMHIAPQALEGENLARTVENNKVLGNPFLIVAAAADRMASKESIAEFAKFLNQASREVEEKDMHVGYHAHGFDFEIIDGRFAWDHLFSQTRKEVVMQMDVGNCLGGGGDPIAMFEKFPGRSLTVHIKEFEEKTFDSDYYKKVFDLCENRCATQWYIVEMGGDGGNGFEVSGDALKKLREIGK
jgi:sugar phosphate isomerase/epimerase